MTFLEVLDDAVKIGLGTLCGWWIARGGRAHEFEKERRRRKQDFLERAAEALDDLTLRMESFLSSEEVVRVVTEDLKLGAREAFLKDFDLLGEAEAKFARLESKLALFDSPQCTKSFKAHQHSTTKLKGALAARSQGRESNVESACDAWWETEREFREQTVSAFRAL